ncbi:MAG: ATP-binding cassette domain-containing protein, partial [Crenarchaeota archaeon]|nr:ATP-binding cassette domain-containing protein [Thermoproteota archaeon]
MWLGWSPAASTCRGTGCRRRGVYLSSSRLGAAGAGVAAERGCDPVAELRGVVKRFRGGPRVGPVSLRVSRGRVTALVGPNGAGKSTTIRMLLGIYE